MAMKSMYIRKLDDLWFGQFFFYLQKKKDLNEMLKETGGKRAQEFKNV